MPNYCDGPSRDLGVYTNKDSSAWTEVWTSTWCPTASIMAPGGRDPEDLNIFRLTSGRAGDIHFLPNKDIYLNKIISPRCNVCKERI